MSHTPPTGGTGVSSPCRRQDSPAVAAVLKAWTDPGPVPGYHRAMQQELRQNWTMLALALDGLAAEARDGHL